MSVRVHKARETTEHSPFTKALARYKRAAMEYGRVEHLRDQGDASYAEYLLAWRALQAAEQAVIDARVEPVH